MVLLNNGKIKAWGSNTNFQLGIEAESNQEVALAQECVIEDIKAIACGYEHTLFLDRNGDLYVCG
jgi:alpha-tubulin suppressor-like RCC1 family protein